MGKLIGLPEWLVVSLFVIIGLAVWLLVGSIGHARMVRRTAAKRANPTREEFLAEMERSGSSADAAEFLWETALFYVQPNLTPHPDDELGEDLFIDDGDWSMDWPRDFAERKGFHKSNLPDWPEGWRVTLRNYGRWLDMGSAG